MNPKLQALLARMTEKKKTASHQFSFYPVRDLPVDSPATIRFLPDANPDNPVFYVDYWMHWLKIGGKAKAVPCVALSGEKCPVCEMSRALYNSGDALGGKQLLVKKQWLTNALIIKDPLDKYVGKIIPVYLDTQIQESIEAAVNDGDLDELPQDFNAGTNFVIKKKMQGNFANYKASKFERQQSPLSGETLQKAKDAVVVLETLLPARMPITEIEDLLVKHMEQ
jgi:hypothetical protein